MIASAALPARKRRSDALDSPRKSKVTISDPSRDNGCTSSLASRIWLHQAASQDMTSQVALAGKLVAASASRGILMELEILLGVYAADINIKLIVDNISEAITTSLSECRVSALQTLELNLHRRINSLPDRDIDILEYDEGVLKEPMNTNGKETAWKRVFDFVGFEGVYMHLRSLSKFHFNLAQDSAYISQIGTLKLTASSFWRTVADPFVLLGKLQSGCGLNITSLSLSGISSIDDGSLLVLSKCLIQPLINLSIQQCNTISPAGLRWLKPKLNLTTLKLAGRNISDEHIVELCHPGLQSLQLRFCKVSASSLEQIGPLIGSSLKSLKLSHCNNIDSRAIEYFGRYCTALRSIDMYQSNCSDSFLNVLNPQIIHTLRLVDCRAISGPGLSSRLTKFSSLEEIDLSFCQDRQAPIDDCTLRTIAQCCPFIRCLDLFYCHLITDTGVSYISTHLKGLRRLNLGYTQITDALLEQLSCRSLRHLSLEGCCFISDCGLRELEPTSLVYLNLSSCNGVSLHSVNYILSRADQLETLDISHCGQLNNASLDELKSIRADVNLITHM